MTRSTLILEFLLCAAVGAFCFYLAHREEVTRIPNRVKILLLQVTGTASWVGMGYLSLGVILSFLSPEDFVSRP